VMLHSSETPKALRAVNPNSTASPELERIIFKALEKDRRKRFANAREFAHAIEEVLPKLDDTAGAPPPLPTAMEATEEATRVVRTPAQVDVATVVTSRGDVANMTLDRVAPAHEGGSSGFGKAIAGIAAAIVIAVIGVLMFRKPEQPAVVAKPPVKATVMTPAPIAQPAAHLGINAFPWATITKIRNVDSGVEVPLTDALMTPAPFELAPGRYEVTLANPKFRDPIRQTVEVVSGEERTIDVHFADPSQAPLPHFGGVE